MTFIWFIVAMGVFFFLLLSGAGIYEYLSTKNKVEKDESDRER